MSSIRWVRWISMALFTVSLACAGETDPCTGRIIIQARWTDFIVYLDHEAVLQRAGTLDQIPCGLHHLEILRRDGWALWTGTILVRSDQPVVVDASWARPRFKTGAVMGAIALGLAGNNYGKSPSLSLDFFSRPFSRLCIGAGITWAGLPAPQGVNSPIILAIGPALGVNMVWDTWLILGLRTWFGGDFYAGIIHPPFCLQFCISGYVDAYHGEVSGIDLGSIGLRVGMGL